MSDLGFTHVAFMVRSLDASAAFYARYADMQIVHRRPGVIWLSDRTRPFVLVCIETTAAITPDPDAHFGVGLASRDAVDARCAWARDEGCLEMAARDSGPPVGYWAMLRDPDGHHLELAYGQEVGLTLTTETS